MKKRMASLLLALALCLSLLPTAALAEESGSAAHAHPLCAGQTCTDPAHADDNHGSVTFETKLWMDGSALKKGEDQWASARMNGADYYVLSTGCYYLATDLSPNLPIRITGDVTLCLNGKSIVSEDRTQIKAIEVIGGQDKAVFTLTDCMGTGTITHGTNNIGQKISAKNLSTVIRMFSAM